MLRKLALSLAVAVASALGVSTANALGLGEIRVNSALNEPLNAEIQLVQVNDLSPMQIQPRLADIDNYSLAGLTKSQFLRDVSFQVRVKPDGSGVIEVHSNQAIKEPFLNLLLEVNWPSGRLVREYTLLLDPPLYDPTPAPAAITPVQSQPVNVAQNNRPQPAPVRNSNPSNIQNAANPATEVYVDVKDTLWDLAQKHRPASSISPEQMMIALLRKNPQAFPSGNINMMRAGVVMQLPTLAEANQLSRSEAAAEVARQARLWKEGRRAPKSQPAAAPIDASPAAKPAAPAEKVPATETPAADETASANKGRLQVVAPDEAEAPTAAESASADDVAQASEATPEVAPEMGLVEQNGELKQQLSQTQQTVQQIQQDNSSLTGKLDQISTQLEAMQRMMQMKDQQLAQLQQELAKQKNEESSALSWPFFTALGGSALALILAGLALVRRRKAAKEDVEAKDGSDLVAPAVAGAAAAVAVEELVSDEKEEQQAQEDVVAEAAPVAEEQQPEPEEDNDDLQDLDLDMDLDLDDDLAPEETASQEDGLDNEEFDLGVDERSGETLPPLSGLADEQEVDSSLDDLLNDADDFEEDMPPKMKPLSSLGDDDDMMVQLDDEPVSLDDDLDFKVDAQPVEEPVAEVESDDSADELEGLDFAVELPAEEELPGEAQEEQIEPVAAEDDADDLLFDEPLEIDTPHDDFDLLDAGAESEAPVESNAQDELDDLLSMDDENEGNVLDMVEATDDEAEGDSVDDDLDALLASYDPQDDSDVEFTSNPKPGERVEEELTANIAHDLESDLDTEIDDMLSAADEDIALEEERNEETEERFDGANLLEGADEVETKLDLARAYMEMEDQEGAKDILNEVLNEGNHFQRREAQRLIESLG